MATTIAIGNEPIVIERTFQAPGDRVWRALTDPRQMRAWYFPMMEDFRAEVGFETRLEKQDYVHIWKVITVVPKRKISYEWRLGGYPGNSLLTFELFEQMGWTWLRLTGDLYPELFRDNFVEGWTHYMGELKAYIYDGPTKTGARR